MFLTKHDNYEVVDYKDGFDHDNYRESMINEISASDDFIKFYAKLTSRNYKDNFYLFGRASNIDINQELIRILNLALVAYNIINKYDQINEDFKNLYFSLYEDRF